VTPGNVELVQVIADWVVTLPATAVLIVRDERRLTGDQLARAWPPSSRDGAILGLWMLGVHPLALAIHWTKTRASVTGFAIGFALLVTVEALGIAAQFVAATAVDWLGL